MLGGKWTAGQLPDPKNLVSSAKYGERDMLHLFSGEGKDILHMFRGIRTCQAAFY